jgi:DNA polymerase
MNDDARKEAADIARLAKRYVERQRAAGLGDLVSRNIMKAAPAKSGGATAPATTVQKRPAPVTVLEAPPAAKPAEKDLFGKSMAKKRDVAKEASAALAMELPSHHEPLNPSGLQARTTLYENSLPVIESIAARVTPCTQCGLHETRTRAVPGAGSAQSGIVFIGEAPGAEEDRQGLPFVGRSGDLLTKMIHAMDEAKLIPGVPLNRDTVYIANVLKCRPPENRNPLPHEIETCSPYLMEQLDAIKPRIICCLGKFAAELLCGVKGTIAGLRGKVYRYKGAKLIVTYHPAACLRNPGYKRPVWEDLQLLAREYAE